MVQFSIPSALWILCRLAAGSLSVCDRSDSGSNPLARLFEIGLVHPAVLTSQSSTFCHFQVVFWNMVACFPRSFWSALFGLSHPSVLLVSILIRFDFSSSNVPSVWGLSWKGGLSSAWFLRPLGSRLLRPLRTFYCSPFYTWGWRGSTAPSSHCRSHAGLLFLGLGGASLMPRGFSPQGQITLGLPCCWWGFSTDLHLEIIT